MNPDRRSFDFAQNWLPAIGNSLKAEVFVLILWATLFVLCTSAEAQQQGRVAKIGWLGARPAGIATGLKLLGQELRKLGYTEGKNITLESRYAEGQ